MMKRLWKKIASHWNKFFFEPISPATLGLFRIVFGIVVFQAVLGKYPIRELFYSNNGFITAGTVDHYFPNAFLYFRWMPDSDPGLKYFFLFTLFSIFCLVIGFQTRIASILVFLEMINISNRNFYVENAGDDLLRINCLILMFAPAGAAYSVDRWIKIKRGLETKALKPTSAWAQRLLQLQLAYLYFETVILKLPGSGWQDGTGLYYALNYLELRRFYPKFLFYYLWQIKLATWGVLVTEFSAWSLIWFRKFRYWVVGAAFMLHFGINLTMQFPVFQYVMMASLINFIYPEDVERVMFLLSQKISRLKRKTGSLIRNPVR